MHDLEHDILKSWLSAREVRVASYRPKIEVNHPILKDTQVIEAIIKAIKHGDLNAIELGCEFIQETGKVPFGKILKSNILTALKQQTNYITQNYRQQLATTAVSLLSWEYPPREVRELCKLVQRFEPRYAELVVQQTVCNSKEGERWVQFLKEGMRP